MGEVEVRCGWRKGSGSSNVVLKKVELKLSCILGRGWKVKVEVIVEG